MRWLILLTGLTFCLADELLPPAPPGLKVKPQVLSSEAPLYHVNLGTTGPTVAAVDGTNILLIVPKAAPQVFIPNHSQASFALLQSSPDLFTWTTVAYFTNFVNGFYLVDVLAANQPKYFYRLVPQ
jgi:hypothetical protein